MDTAKHTALTRAKERLDRLELYPRPVSLRGVSIWIAPRLFRLPWFRRFDGYAAHWTILLRSRELLADEELVAHELCHVWQMQHRPVRMPLSYLVRGYASNPYEREAREASRRRRVLVFLHGTAIMHAAAAAVPREERVAQVVRGDAGIRDFDAYVPTPGAVAKVRAWEARGAEIVYLSSHRDLAGVAADERVLRRDGFPAGPVLCRRPGESYGDVATAAHVDVLVEDDCESIGGAPQQTHPQLPGPERQRVHSVVVPEFGGLEALPDDLRGGAAS